MVIGRTLSEVGDTEFDMADKADRGNYLEMSGLLRNTTHNEEIPIVFLHPKTWNGNSVIWVHEQGKAGLFEADGGGYRPNAGVRKLLADGATVIGVDLLYQGEFLKNEAPHDQARKVANPREFAGYTHGFNHSLFARRAHDILSVIDFVHDHERKSDSIDLIGLKGAGHWVAAARAVAGGVVTRAAIDTGGFRFHKVDDIRHVDFQPGGAKYDDLPGMLAVAAPGKLWLAGEKGVGRSLVEGFYKTAGAAGNLTSGEDGSAAAVAWLMK